MCPGDLNNRTVVVTLSDARCHWFGAETGWPGAGMLGEVKSRCNPQLLF